MLDNFIKNYNKKVDICEKKNQILEEKINYEKNKYDFLLEKKEEIKKENKGEIKGEIKEEIKCEIRCEMKEEMKDEVKEEIREEIRKEVKDEIIKVNINKVNDVMTEFVNNNMCFYMGKIHDLTEELDIIKTIHNENTEKFNEMNKISESNLLEYSNKFDELKRTILEKCSFDINMLMPNPTNICFTDTNKIHQYIIPEKINLIFVTIVGGGGAGGIGYCSNQYFYSGGGGGAGACIIKKPIKVEPNLILYIKVGEGGNSKDRKHGESSYIRFCFKSNDNRIKAKGGKNGYPQLKDGCDLDLKVDGGEGGELCYPFLSGNNGEDGKMIPTKNYHNNKCYKKTDYNFPGTDGCDGEISFPSGPTSCPGSGGCSVFYDGGCGGTNYFSDGGKCGNNYNSIGYDGSYGSGGGGSCPKYKLDFCKKLSGNGGDGIIIIELGAYKNS